MLGDPTDYSKGMGKLTSAYKTNRIWDTAARLAEVAYFNVTIPSQHVQTQKPEHSKNLKPP
jgi:hypothetical protein